MSELRDDPEAVQARLRAGAILLADASPEGEAIGTALRSRGFDVTATSIAELEARLGRDAPRVVIVDIDQPGAIEALERLYHHRPGGVAASVLLVGDPARSAELDPQLFGQVFERPVDIAELAAHVSAVAEPVWLRSDHGAAPRPPTAPPGPLDQELPSSPDFSRELDPLDVGSVLPPPEDGEAVGSRLLPARISPELEEILVAAEQRVTAKAHPSSIPAAEEEVDLILSPELLSALDEPIDPDDDEPRTGANAAFAPLHASPAPHAAAVSYAASASQPRTGEGTHGGAAVPHQAATRSEPTGPGEPIDELAEPGDEPHVEPPLDAAYATRRTGAELAALARDPEALLPEREDREHGSPPPRWGGGRDAAPPTPREAVRPHGGQSPPPRAEPAWERTPAPPAASRAEPAWERTPAPPAASRAEPAWERTRDPRAPGFLPPAAAPPGVALAPPTAGASPPGRALMPPAAPVAAGALGRLPAPAPLSVAVTGAPGRAPAPPAPPVPSAPATVSTGALARAPLSYAAADEAPSSAGASATVLGPGDAPRALARAVGSRASGSLAVSTEAGVRRIVLHEGDLVTAGSGIADETLLAFLVGRGDIAREVAARLSGKLPASGRHAGAALIAHGHLGQDDLWPVLRAHAEWIIGHVVLVEAGTCDLESEPPGRLKAEPNVFGGATGAEVFVETVRRVIAPEVALRRLGGPGARLDDGVRRNLLGECALRREEEELVRSARGRAVGELVGAAEPDHASVLYALVCLEVLDVLIPPSITEAPPAPVADPLDEEAIRQRVRARLALVEEGDYFSILGVPRDATSYEIRRAYLALRRAFEPSTLLTAATVDLLDDVRLVIEVLDEAYEILREPHRRERYRRAIEAGPP
ncbi:hypothetical protein WMF31_39220 [Sorangium sp. So ce1036]|uniref:hypothetical protein n=1 Tax=Sorangium sp. So ce1036 TaxID=3133328 RepID=UPI003F0827A4